MESESPRKRAPSDLGYLRRKVQSEGIESLSQLTIERIHTFRSGEIEHLLLYAKDSKQFGHLLLSDEMKEKRAAQKPKPRQSGRKPQHNPRLKGRLIRTPRDAELAAVASMKYLGFSDAQETPVGADEGIDVNSTRAVAQVKAYMVPVGRPDVQNLAGVAAAEKKRGVFFALSGYTPQAIQWADKANVALFSFDLQGRPEAVNSVAHKLLP